MSNLGSVGGQDQRPFPGALFLSAIVTYGVARFAHPPACEAGVREGALNVPQALSTTLAVLSPASLLVLRLGRSKPI
jgi:hypothetical protein